MARSGTIITLATLVASMSVGACVLILMETEPAEPTGPVLLSASDAQEAGPELAIVHRTDAALQFIKWRNIVVHDSRCPQPGIADGCHFIIGRRGKFGDGAIYPTRRWRLQQDGNHVRVPGFNFNANSVGICVLRDDRAGGLTRKQFDALVRLIRALQITCSIPRDHVYLHSELANCNCPASNLAADALRRRLIPTAK